MKLLIAIFDKLTFYETIKYEAKKEEDYDFKRLKCNNMVRRKCIDTR